MQNLRPHHNQCRYFRHYFKDLLRIDDKTWVSDTQTQTFTTPILASKINTRHGIGRGKLHIRS